MIIDHERVSDKNPANEAGYTPLHLAAIQGHLNICKLIIEHREVSDKNPSNRHNGRTPLHLAASNGKLEICKLMADNVMSDHEDVNGNTPLHEAARNGHWEVCKLIARNVGNKNPVNNKGKTPLDLAKDGGNIDIVQYPVIWIFKE